MQPTFIQVQESDCPPSIRCGQCGNPWDEPTELVPCSHIFCKRCSEQSGWSCPTCLSAVDDKAPAHDLLQALANRAQVQCTGCGWQGMRQSTKVHRCPPPREAENVRIQPPNAHGCLLLVGAPTTTTATTRPDLLTPTPTDSSVMGVVIGGPPPGWSVGGSNSEDLPPPPSSPSTGIIQQGQVVEEEVPESSFRGGTRHHGDSAALKMITSVSVIRSASDPKARKPWFDYNLTRNEYTSIKSDFQRAALSSSPQARIGKDAVNHLLKSHHFELQHPHQEIKALMSLFNDKNNKDDAEDQTSLVSLEELLTWLRYSTATKVSSGSRTKQARRQKEMEATEEEQSKERISHFVRDEMKAPSVMELTTGLGGLPPVSSFGLAGDSSGAGGGMDDMLAKFSLGDGVTKY